MTLPPITIPVEIPAAILDVIPVLVHPAIVHFAIVLPLIILMLEVINLFMKRKSLTVSVYLMFVLVMIVFIGAYLTGGVDGSEAYPLLSGDGKAELKEHKLLGTYLVYLTLVPILFKMLSVVIKKTWFRMFYMLILAGFIAVTLFQGKEGGHLVYKYGANVQSVSEAQEKIEELKVEMEDLEPEIEELESEIETLQGKIKELESAPVQVVEPEVEDTIEQTTESVQEDVKEEILAVEEQIEESIKKVEDTELTIETVVDAVDEDMTDDYTSEVE